MKPLKAWMIVNADGNRGWLYPPVYFRRYDAESNRLKRDRVVRVLITKVPSKRKKS